jgi:hypothetical protein
MCGDSLLLLLFFVQKPVLKIAELSDPSLVAFEVSEGFLLIVKVFLFSYGLDNESKALQFTLDNIETTLRRGVLAR